MINMFTLTEAEEVIRKALSFEPRLRPTARQLLLLDWLTVHQPVYIARHDGTEQEVTISCYGLTRHNHLDIQPVHRSMCFSIS